MTPETKAKQYVFSARTTEGGLKALNRVREERNVGWDRLVTDAVADFYGIERSVLVDEAAEAEKTRKAEEKAKKDKEKAGTKKKAQKKQSESGGGNKARKKAQDKPTTQEPTAEQPEPQATQATDEPATGDVANES